MKQTNVRLPADLREALEERAKAEGRTLTWLLELGASIVIADPSLTGPQDIEQLRAELAAARAEAEEARAWATRQVEEANQRLLKEREGLLRRLQEARAEGSGGRKWFKRG